MAFSDRASWGSLAPLKQPAAEAQWWQRQCLQSHVTTGRLMRACTFDDSGMDLVLAIIIAPVLRARWNAHLLSVRVLPPHLALVKQVGPQPNNRVMIRQRSRGTRLLQFGVLSHSGLVLPWADLCRECSSPVQVTMGMS